MAKFGKSAKNGMDREKGRIYDFLKADSAFFVSVLTDFFHFYSCSNNALIGKCPLNFFFVCTKVFAHARGLLYIL